jgi:anti-anti-sigma factor
VNAERRTTPQPDKGTLVLHLFGACEAATETGLRLQLRRAAAAADGRRLVVDLSDVPFMDAAGLAVLIEAQVLTGNRLTIQNPPISLTRILAALDLTGYFTVVDTRLDDARGAGGQIA